jgi:hypothetical protein
MEGLSIAANVLAVVGAADIAIRGTTSLINLVGAIKTAPKQVESLRSEVRDLGNTIVRVRTFVSKFQSSPASAQDSRSLEDLELALKGCQGTLCRLRRSLEELRVEPIGNLFGQLRWRTGYVLSDTKIRDMCQELERRKTTLIALLAITGKSDCLIFSPS